MKKIVEIEQRISSGGRRQKTATSVFAVLFLVFGAAIFYQGYGMITGRGSGLIIGADTDVTATPPTPPTPPAAETPVTPIDLGKACDEETCQITIPAGWSMASGVALSQIDLTSVYEQKIILYSFNDPLYPLREWVTYPYAQESGSAKKIKPIEPLAYYLYNPNSSGSTLTVALKTTQSDYEKIYSRGWHLLYWPNDATTKEDLQQKTTISYSNNSSYSLKELSSVESHAASEAIYVVVNEGSVDGSAVVKKLGDTDDETTISKIPAHSFYWIYLRRTRVRATEIVVNNLNL